MLDQNNVGGAAEATRYNSWLANVPAVAATSGPQNRSLFGYADESGIEESVKEREDDSLEWDSDDLKRWAKEYPNKWIVVKNRSVVEVSDDLVDLLGRASRAGIMNPLVLKMDELPKRKWRTVF
jgi:uncharacterized protein DUF5678